MTLSFCFQKLQSGIPTRYAKRRNHARFPKVIQRTKPLVLFEVFKCNVIITIQHRKMPMLSDKVFYGFQNPLPNWFDLFLAYFPNGRVAEMWFTPPTDFARTFTLVQGIDNLIMHGMVVEHFDPNQSFFDILPGL